jgi:hypothetical protein
VPITTPVLSDRSQASSLVGDVALNLRVQYINKTPNSNDRSVAFTSTFSRETLIVRHGENDKVIFKVDWNSKNLERSSITTESQTRLVKDTLKKGGLLSSTLQSRSFVGPDGAEYKWKTIYCGNNPCYPDSFYRDLYVKDSKHPVATTERLTSRDGKFVDESHPIYIAERGLALAPWIVATTAVLDRVQMQKKSAFN